ncbi:uncharacterized protein GLRG_06168 [Colletotrichum graminicola M1.001]|uniref:MARVEL domain-containing protein n=1 Tax=Colletotrichum graminicola (strain M1.001 / M2 / FGSC 10212) TaxID=645133 RepID=E3QJI6_COLGM|nr:uncharacterized protein GLRG_06168 [Colletotrichum graminicola M1.001]EFQ31024.1 hypothetical protein GLRG_06168 [Colletotrichum graminicola M1.001]
MTTGADNIRGLTGKGVPPTPSLFAIARVATLVLSLAVLAASAFCLSLLGIYSGSFTGPPGFMLFVALFTIVVLGGAIAIERFAAHLYFRIVMLVGYGLTCLFWLAGWAWSASIAKLFLGDTCIGRTCFGPTTEEMRYGGSMAGAAAVGAINWLLMGIVVFYFIKGCVADPDCYGVATGHESEMGSIKAERKSRS